MNYYRMNPLLKRGGGGYSETLLWTNTSPNATFPGQTLSGVTITDYEYIKIVYKNTRTQDRRCTIIVSVEGSDYSMSGLQGWNNSLGSYYLRPFWRDRYGNNDLHFESASRVASSGEDDNMCIPLEVYGVNIS